MKKIIFALTIALFSSLSFASSEDLLAACDNTTLKGAYRFQNHQDTGTFVFDSGEYVMYGVRLSNSKRFHVVGTYTIDDKCTATLSKQVHQKQGLRIFLTNISHTKKFGLLAFGGILHTGSMQRYIGR